MGVFHFKQEKGVTTNKILPFHTLNKTTCENKQSSSKASSSFILIPNIEPCIFQYAPNKQTQKQVYLILTLKKQFSRCLGLCTVQMVFSQDFIFYRAQILLHEALGTFALYHSALRPFQLVFSELCIRTEALQDRISEFQLLFCTFSRNTEYIRLQRKICANCIRIVYFGSVWVRQIPVTFSTSILAQIFNWKNLSENQIFWGKIVKCSHLNSRGIYI